MLSCAMCLESHQSTHASSSGKREHTHSLFSLFVSAVTCHSSVDRAAVRGEPGLFGQLRAGAQLS